MQSYRVPIILLFHYSGKNFHYSWFFVIFAGNEREMTHTDFDGIIFADTLQEFNALRYAGRVIHILCSGGNMGFTFQDTRYNIAAGDYVILPNATLVSEFSDSEDFQGILMNLSDAFVSSIAIRSNYGIIGYLSLLQNPVMKLSSHDFQVCEQAMRCIRQRLNPYPVVYSYSVGSLLTELVDLDAPAASKADAKLPVLWTAYMSGLLSGSDKFDTQLAVRAIEQAFVQSPYVKK